jgi:hypothetical protein
MSRMNSLHEGLFPHLSVLAQRFQHPTRLHALVVDEDVEGLVERLSPVRDGSRTTMRPGLSTAPSAVRSTLPAMASPTRWRREREVHVVAGRGEPTRLVVGEQEQEILGGACSTLRRGRRRRCRRRLCRT